LAVIPFASGLAGMLTGPATLPGEPSTVTATLDGEYRFVNAFWFATAPILWLALPHIEEKSPIIRTALGTAFIGGLVRLISWRRVGRPHGIFMAAIALELVGMPALAIWHRRVTSISRGPSRAMG
jgi:hypothetical protein